MAIKMVREPSETPNINNIDDIVPMRYAYGNQNGYVIGKGNEISNTVNGLNFTVNSGRLVLQGVECDIDAVGVTITIDNIATTRYYVVYLQVNLGTNTASILSSYDTATYPSIDEGDDLTENTTGVARLPLYRFTATSGIISDVNKVVENIKYTKDVEVSKSVYSSNSEISNKTNKVVFDGYGNINKINLTSINDLINYMKNQLINIISFKVELSSDLTLDFYNYLSIINGKITQQSSSDQIFSKDTVLLFYPSNLDKYSSGTKNYSCMVSNIGGGNFYNLEFNLDGETLTFNQSGISIAAGEFYATSGGIYNFKSIGISNIELLYTNASVQEQEEGI